MKSSIILPALLIGAMSLQAQVPDRIQRATMSGSQGAAGKCTIEVRVDNVAEVDIYGNMGRLRTLAGQPASWTRLECTDALPYNMSDFRFTGIDGRGKVQLVQDPRNNNSTAVIRVEDTKSGAEGFTFEIQWSGASGGAPTEGFSNTGVLSPSAGGSRGQRNSRQNRGGRRAISAEQAIDLCRTEVRSKAERDYNLRNVDITAAAVEANAGQEESVVGAFNDGTRRSRQGSGYRFRCSVDYSAGQIRAVEIMRPDGSAVQSAAYGSNSQPRYDETRVFRACQDAVVARTGRDGYQNVNFTSTAVETNRNGRVSGRLTASRGRVNDTFDFSCSMDLGSASVSNVELNRR